MSDETSQRQTLPDLITHYSSLITLPRLRDLQRALAMEEHPVAVLRERLPAQLAQEESGLVQPLAGERFAQPLRRTGEEHTHPVILLHVFRERLFLRITVQQRADDRRHG